MLNRNWCDDDLTFHPLGAIYGTLPPEMTTLFSNSNGFMDKKMEKLFRVLGLGFIGNNGKEIETIIGV